MPYRRSNHRALSGLRYRLAQREPTDGTLVRRGGHGESRVTGAVCCTAAAERLPYRQVNDGGNPLSIVELRFDGAAMWGCWIVSGFSPGQVCE